MMIWVTANVPNEDKGATMNNTEMNYKKEYEEGNGQMRLLKRIPRFW